VTRKRDTVRVPLTAREARSIARWVLQDVVRRAAQQPSLIGSHPEFAAEVKAKREECRQLASELSVRRNPRRQYVELPRNLAQLAVELVDANVIRRFWTPPRIAHFGQRCRAAVLARRGPKRLTLSERFQRIESLQAQAKTWRNDPRADNVPRMLRKARELARREARWDAWNARLIARSETLLTATESPPCD